MNEKRIEHESDTDTIVQYNRILESLGFPVERTNVIARSFYTAIWNTRKTWIQKIIADQENFTGFISGLFFFFFFPLSSFKFL